MRREKKGTRGEIQRKKAVQELLLCVQERSSQREEMREDIKGCNVKNKKIRRREEMRDNIFAAQDGCNATEEAQQGRGLHV
jgi:hypothetical protein